MRVAGCRCEMFGNPLRNINNTSYPNFFKHDNRPWSSKSHHCITFCRRTCEGSCCCCRWQRPCYALHLQSLFLSILLVCYLDQPLHFASIYVVCRFASDFSSRRSILSCRNPHGAHVTMLDVLSMLLFHVLQVDLAAYACEVAQILLRMWCRLTGVILCQCLGMRACVV